MRLNNIYPGLVASDFLVTENNHSWRIWLWESQEDLIRWGEIYGDEEEPGFYDDSLGLHCPLYGGIDTEGYPQHLGDIHFVKDNWNIKVVSHEMLHAMFWYIRCLVNDFSRALYRNWMDEEEKLCYPFGEWVAWIYDWLWKHNPYGKWA